MKEILTIYKKLYSLYGTQGWWPILELNNSTKINITKSGSLKGYHPGDYSYPRNERQSFEICLGAILTQNTSWLSVEKALFNLRKSNAITLKGIKNISGHKLKECIKPAGYFNQKADYIREFTNFFEELKGRIPTREEVLAVKGVGDETADSIMLYAFKKLHFVVDAYTRRIFSCLGLIDEKASYSEIQSLFEKNLPKDLVVYQEYHALIVEHAKQCYNKKPYCPDDVLKELIKR